MPIQKTNTADSIYNDIDEVLAAPPSKLIRYSNTIFLVVLLIVISVLYFVQYTDGINCKAVLTNLNTVEVKTPKNETIIKRVFVQEATIVKKGDYLLVLQSLTTKVLDTLKAPIAGKILLKRNLIVENILEPNNNICLINGLNPSITVKLVLEENADKQRIKLGQQVNIYLPKYNLPITATIISLPYLVNEKSSYVLDANLSTNTNCKDMALILLNTNTATAFINVEKKRLFGKLF